MSGRESSETLLRVDGLSIEFEFEGKKNTILNGIDLTVGSEEVVGLTGRSGSGKTSLALAIIGLLPPESKIRSGRILMNGVDLLRLSPSRRHRYRGSQIGLVFQDPAVSLNPVMQIHRQLSEGLKQHLGLNGRKALERSKRLLEEVGIVDATRCLRAYPHQLSGGMCQRVLIAAAISCNPRLLICDEPTSALDAVISTQIRQLLFRLKQTRNLSMLFISHDLESVQLVSDRVYRLEEGTVCDWTKTKPGT